MAIGIYHHNRGLVTVDKMNNRWYLFDFKKLGGVYSAVPGNDFVFFGLVL